MEISMATFSDLILIGSTIIDRKRGGETTDRITGSDHNDFLRGGSGADLVLGGKGADFMRGGRGDDALYGGEGNDVLWGGPGRDFLSGDAGFDSLIGGFGADIFAFDVSGGMLGDGFDKVQDFVIGEDKLLILGGSQQNVTFVDEGIHLGVYYDGVKIANLMGIASVPEDTSVFFADAPLG
jgi:Ca2+-binding RTX toxin-like protein